MTPDTISTTQSNANQPKLLESQEFIDAASQGNLDIVEQYIEENKTNPAAINTRDAYGNTALLKAAESGQLSVVQTLLAVEGIDINRANHCQDTALIWAAINGHLKVVQTLLAVVGIEIDKANDHSDTALMQAAHKNHAKVVKALVEKGANVNLKNHNRMTALERTKDKATREAFQIFPLFQAAKTGDVSLLNDLQISIDTPNSSGDSPLMIAVRFGHAKVVQALVSQGANMDFKNEQSGLSMVDEVVKANNPAINHILQTCKFINLARGKDVSALKYYISVNAIPPSVINGTDENKRTPLINAAFAKAWDSIPILLSMDHIDVNAKDKNNETALTWAAYAGNFESVVALVNKGADLLHKNNNGLDAEQEAISQGKDRIVSFLRCTLLWQTVKSGDHVAIKKIIEKYKQSTDTLNSINADGDTLLTWAARNGHLDIVLSLKNTNVSMNSCNAAGDTPLILAVRNGDEKLLNALITQGSDNFNNAKTGLCAIDEARLKGHESILRILQSYELYRLVKSADVKGLKKFLNEHTLSYGVINTCNQFGITPLIKAAEDGLWEILAILLTVPNVNVNISDDKGETALIHAAISGDLPSVQALVNKGANILHRNRGGCTAEKVASIKRNGAIVEFLRSTLLARTVNSGELDSIKSMIEEYKNTPKALNTTLSNGDTVFIWAVRNNHLDIVLSLLHAHVDIDNHVHTAIDIAKEQNRPDMVEVLQRVELLIAIKEGDLSFVDNFLQAYPESLNCLDAEGNTPLMVATRHGHGAIVDLLLSKPGIAIDAMNKDGFTALMIASKRGLIPIILTLLKQNANFEFRNPTQASAETVALDQTIANIFRIEALVQAASKGNVTLLEERMAKISGNSQNAKGDTALIAAARNGHLSVILTLLEKQVDITLMNHVGNTAADEARQSGHAIILKRLENAVFLKATTRGDLDFVQNYLQVCPEAIFVADAYGATALILASLCGHLPIVQTLLAKGCSPNHKNRFHDTALHWAAQKGHLQVVQTLIKNKADLLTKNLQGFTAGDVAQGEIAQVLQQSEFFQAARVGDLMALTRRLKQVSIDAVNEAGDTALMLAVRNGHEDIIRSLLTAGAIGTIKNEGFSAIDMAKQAGHNTIVQILQKSEFSRLTRLKLADELTTFLAENKLPDEVVNNQENGNRATPLIQAAKDGAVALLQTLLTIPNINLNAQDLGGETALAWAAFRGDLASVQALLEKGADISFENHLKHTAEMQAIDRGHRAIVNLIRRTALIRAINRNDFDSIKRLIEENKDNQAVLTVELANGDSLLMWAIRHDHLNLMLTLLIADVGLKDDSAFKLAREGGRNDLVEILERAQFLNAVKAGDVDFVNVYLQNKPEALQSVDHDGNTPLMLAALYERGAMVDLLLLKPGIAIDATNNNGFTAFMFAAQKGNENIVRALMNQGSNIDLANSAGAFADSLARNQAIVQLIQIESLFRAASTGNLPILQQRLGQVSGNSINTQGDTPLIAAARHGHLNIVKALLEKEVNIALKNPAGNSAADEARRNGHAVILKRLDNEDFFQAVIRGDLVSVEGYLQANPEAIDDANAFGCTPLILAIINNRLPIVASLLAKGASVHVVNQFGDTALTWAADKGNLTICQAILNKGADVYIQNHNGSSALDNALRRSHREIISALQRAQSEDLLKAVMAGDLGRVEKFAAASRKSINPNKVVDNLGNTPLMLAVRQVNLAMVKLLLNAPGIEINAVDRENESSALMLAATIGNKEIVEALIKHKANPILKDKASATAELIARMAGYIEVAVVLKAAEIQWKEYEMGNFVKNLVLTRVSSLELKYDQNYDGNINPALKIFGTAENKMENGRWEIFVLLKNEAGEVAMRSGVKSKSYDYTDLRVTEQFQFPLFRQDPAEDQRILNRLSNYRHGHPSLALNFKELDRGVYATLPVFIGGWLFRNDNGAQKRIQVYLSSGRYSVNRRFSSEQDQLLKLCIANQLMTEYGKDLVVEFYAFSDTTLADYMSKNARGGRSCNWDQWVQVVTQLMPAPNPADNPAPTMSFK